MVAPAHGARSDEAGSSADEPTPSPHVELTLGSRLWRRLLALLTAAYVALFSSVYLALAGVPLWYLVGGALFALLAWVLSKRFSPRRIALGADGLAVDRAFLNIEDVQWVRVHEQGGAPRGLHIGRRGDAPLILPFRAPRERYPEIARTLSEAVVSAQLARAQALRSLERGQRTIAEWRADLVRPRAAALGLPHGGDCPRTTSSACSAIPRPRPSSASAPAIALRAKSADTRRVRVAAEGAAEPRLRIALTRLAEEDDARVAETDAAIEEALAREPPRI
jgi:hypothetical protein